ncbi:MAG: hypothetical protein OEN20_13870 [Gammaproteobacteria bacterium]|nr:hypothetical protein [Gammaproteobacteria bacterium]
MAMAERSAPDNHQQIVSLTVRSSAWRHLARTVDPRREELVFVWGVLGSASKSGWTVAVLPREDEIYPEDHFFRARLGDYMIVVPQSNHVDKLNGRTLQYENNDLSVL